MIYTAIFSRNMSLYEGKSNGKSTGTLLQIVEGDKVSDYSAKPEMKRIFYWRTVDLTDEQKIEINRAINSPEINESGITVYPKKSVTLNSFTESDKTKLNKRGSLPEKLGGALQFVNFDIKEVD